jgi:GNAT superfamily N-acetyltransferase
MTYIRRIRPGDRAQLAAMLERCTPATRYRRFHGVVGSFPARYLDSALAGDPFHFALVAWIPNAIVALASCVTLEDGTVELGILVEDASQRQGLGTRLLRLLVEHADRGGRQILHAAVLAEQPWFVRLLSAYGSCETATSDGVIDVTLYRKDT